MSNHPARREPEHPSKVHLGSDEVEAIKIARRNVPEAMRRLVSLTREKNPSQARQAIEVLFQYGLANRQQQYDMLTGEPVEGDTSINLTLNKVEIRLAEVVQNMPPHLKAQFAELIEQMEMEADAINMPIIDGEIVREPARGSRVETQEEDRGGDPCECGCSGYAKPGSRFLPGHQFRKSVKGPSPHPKEIKRLKESGQWEQVRKTLGPDPKKIAKAKKERIKAKKRRLDG